MSLSGKIMGNFEIEPALRDAIIGPDEGWQYHENPHVVFAYENPLLDASASYTDIPFDWSRLIPGPPIDETAYVYFNVSKTEATKALNLLVRCTVRVMVAIDADLIMSFEESPKLMRRQGRVTLFRSLPKDDDFWDSEGRLSLVAEPYEWHRLPTPRWYEEMKAKGEL